MRQKILTIDDSKTVRMVIRKIFRPFDCEILEAANGVEGLSEASKSQPNLILLDITMPVMDGVETLTRLKADPAVKDIPVIMLTAEGGRDHVLKIAKLGIRDYVVKPFKEDTLAEKVGRVIELKPAGDGSGRQKSLLDPIEILVVEDKAAIVQMLVEGLKHLPWKVQGVGSQADALEACNQKIPDLIIASLSLPDESAFALFRAVRKNLKTKFTPFFGLAVKTDTQAQNHAQEVGISAVVTKPIDCGELEAKITKALSLDVSSRYFQMDASCLTITLPEVCSAHQLADVTEYLEGKLSEAVDAGLGKFVIDLRAVRSLHIGVIRLVLEAIQVGRGLTMRFALAGNPHLITESKGLADTANWRFHASLEEAKAQLGQAAPEAVAV
jgi:two-component system cell cycle response regulator